MEQERKIVHMDSVHPVKSRKQIKARVFLLAGLAALAGLVVFIGARTGGTELKEVGGFTLATVQQVDFVKKTDASGEVVTPVKITVTSPQEGYMDRVLVKEGDSVEKNQVLAVLDVPDLIADKDDLEAQLEVARLSLESLKIDNAYTLANLEIQIKRKETAIAEARKDLELKAAVKDLRSSKQSEYDDALDALTTLEQAQEDLRAELAKTRSSAGIGEKKQGATINELQMQLERKTKNIEAARIKSPMAGQVLSIASDIQVSGTLVEKYAEVLVVADRGVTYVDFEVDEQYVEALKTGGPMSISVGTKTMNATILSIGSVASMSSDGLSATVTVRARPDTDQSLTPGASAVASIILGTKANTLVLPRGAWLTTGGQKYVYRVESGKAVKTPVTVGDIQNMQVEIKSGLKAGDQVIVSGYQDFIDQSTVELGKEEAK